MHVINLEAFFKASEALGQHFVKLITSMSIPSTQYLCGPVVSISTAFRVNCLTGISEEQLRFS